MPARNLAMKYQSPIPEVKVTKEGQPCRHCGTPVIKTGHNSSWKPKAGQPYYFEYWFKCPNRKCKAIFMVEDAKVFLYDEKQESLLERIAELDLEFEHAISK